ARVAVIVALLARSASLAPGSARCPRLRGRVPAYGGDRLASLARSRVARVYRDQRHAVEREDLRGPHRAVGGPDHVLVFVEVLLVDDERRVGGADAGVLHPGVGDVGAQAPLAQ